MIIKYLLADAAYRTACKQKNWRLNGRKAFFRLFFRSKTAYFCHSFLLNRNQRENCRFPSEVHLFSIRCEGTKISGNFTNWSQLKTRCCHEYFAAKRENRLCHWWTLANRLVCLAKPSLFFPLFWLYFIRRIYEYGDKVKVTFRTCRIGENLVDIDKMAKKIWWKV